MQDAITVPAIRHRIRKHPVKDTLLRAHTWRSEANFEKNEVVELIRQNMLWGRNLNTEAYEWYCS